MMLRGNRMSLRIGALYAVALAALVQGLLSQSDYVTLRLSAARC